MITINNITSKLGQSTDFIQIDIFLEVNKKPHINCRQIFSKKINEL